MHIWLSDVICISTFTCPSNNESKKNHIRTSSIEWMAGLKNKQTTTRSIVDCKLCNACVYVSLSLSLSIFLYVWYFSFKWTIYFKVTLLLTLIFILIDPLIVWVLFWQWWNNFNTMSKSHLFKNTQKTILTLELWLDYWLFNVNFNSIFFCCISCFT